MTGDDVIKALESENTELMNRVFDLESEKEALIAGQETLQKALVEKNAEIEDLKESRGFPFFAKDTQLVKVSRKADGQYSADCVTAIQVDKIRAEAIKEFAERLKDKSVFLEDIERYVGNAVKVGDIDNLVKELTEGSNGE